MADLPIPFSAPMVRALLREIEHPGTGKTQTRRPMPYQDHLRQAYSPFVSGTRILNYACEEEISRPPISKGDRLWCREEHYQFGHWEVDPTRLTAGGREKWKFVPDSDEVRFDPPAEFRRGRHHRDPSMPAWHKRLGRFMFRKHSRLTLYVTDVRVERLQSISEEDALADGVPNDDDYIGSFDKEYCHHCGGSGVHGALGNGYGATEVACAQCETPKLRYRNLWNHINGPGAWAANPWVSVTTFAPRLGNIDSLPRGAHQRNRGDLTDAQRNAGADRAGDL